MAASMSKADSISGGTAPFACRRFEALSGSREGDQGHLPRETTTIPSSPLRARLSRIPIPHCQASCKRHPSRQVWRVSPSRSLQGIAFGRDSLCRTRVWINLGKRRLLHHTSDDLQVSDSCTGDDFADQM